MYNLDTPFKNLRKAGLIARQNFSCCSGCAGYAIATDAARMTKEGKKVQGCVFFHKQDTNLAETTGKMMLRYGQLDTNELGKIGLDTVTVGNMVKAEMEKAGFEVLWDGKGSSCIEVIVDKAQAERYDARMKARA